MKKKELQVLERGPGHTYNRDLSEQHSKYRIGKCPALIEYMDSGFKNSPLSMAE